MWKYIPYSVENTRGAVGGFFDPRPSMSYGCNITVWIGARRIGKTYSAKKWVLKRVGRREDAKFAWLRDNDEARKKLAMNNGDKFFSDCKKMNIDNINGSIEGETIKAFGRVVGYLMPSSTFQNYKGNDFEEIETIVFDEFIAEKNKKTNANRGWEILNMLYTICSTRKNVKILMLANALDRGDDFLQLLGVDIREYGIYINREKNVCIHYCDDHPEFRKEREQSVIGKIIKGTEFEDNLFNNKFADDTQLFYDKRPTKCELFCIVHGELGAVRVYSKDGTLYCCKDFNSDTQVHKRVCNDYKMVSSNVTLCPKLWLDYLRMNFAENNVFFDNAFSKNIFINFVKNR